VDMLAHTRTGRGEPLVLLHPLGSGRHVWEPALPLLAQRYDVIALDLPGFGESPPLPDTVEPTPAALAAAVAATLDALGVRRPHVAGNSLGGWVALELAALRPLRSVALLSPAGLWRERTPRYCRVSLRLSRWLARRAEPTLSRLVGHPAGRALVLGQTHGRPTRMPADRARAAVRAMARSTGFDRVLAATAYRSYLPPSAPPPMPVSVAYGTRDLLLPAAARIVGLLPPGTPVARLPGCGHVPVDDDPGAVARFILDSTARALPVPAGS
jgi:pimeloyl-ACP methyl ester carboxylesterase